MIFNTSNLFNAVLILSATVLLIYLGKETKKSMFPGAALVVFLGLLIIHAIQYFIYLGQVSADIISILTNSMLVDFGLIAVSFLGYLWVDEIEAKAKKKKSIDNSLDWFWKEV